MEASADALCFPPYQAAMKTFSIPIYDQLELVGYVERALNVECGPSRGHIADNTADGTTIAKTDGCGLQHAGSEFVALFVHRIKPEATLLSWNFLLNSFRLQVSALFAMQKKQVVRRSA